MNLRDLDYICSLAEFKHFGRASEHCHVSQPTLSGQIKKLELTLGVKLFERGHKGVQVTPIGEEIVALAQQIKQSITQIQNVALAAQDPYAGQISLGLIPTIAPYLIPLFAGNLDKQFPKLSIAYREDITERLTQDLISGAIDAAILATPLEDNSLASIALYSEPFWLIAPDSHPIASHETIDMQDINLDDLLLLTEGHCFRDHALSVCQPKQPAQQQSLRATSLETLINLVAAGQGITLVPALALRTGQFYDMGISAHKLNDTQAYRDIHLCYRKQFPRFEALNAIARQIKSGLSKSVIIAQDYI